MNKEDFLKYITQAIEAMDGSDIEALFPDNRQPDLNTFAEELIGLRGEVKKVVQSTLRTNNDVQSMIEQQKNIALDTKETIESFQNDFMAHTSEEPDEYRELLLQIMEQDDMMQRTNEHFKTLSEPTFFNLSTYRQQMASWKKGYEMGTQKWSNLVKSTGLYATGKVGEAFNPFYHEAIATKSDTTKAENIILEIEVLGFIRKQKVIRRAKVVVNKLQ